MSRPTSHVAVLMGGFSSEREVSLSSGKECADALEGEGFRVSRIDVTRDVARVLAELKPDVCFNALHGRWGEDGTIQGILEYLQIPYTHSGVLASSLAMDKQLCKPVLEAAGIPLAESFLISRRDAARKHAMDRPYVLKPPTEGSSVGIHIVREGDPVPKDGLLAFGPDGTSPDMDELLMAERYIAGRELTCACFGERATGVTEILPAEGLAFYDYEAKYAPGGSHHDLPAKISSNIYQSIQKLTVAAHEALGCRGVTRTDFRFDDRAGVGPEGSGELVCLELNTQPGMTQTSLVPELAAHMGMSFGELVRWIVEDASCNR